jgi:hypothetical protein
MSSKKIIVVSVDEEGALTIMLDVDKTGISTHALVGILEQIKGNVLDTINEGNSPIDDLPKKSKKYDA